MHSTSRCSLFIDYLQDIINTLYVKKALKGRKCEDNSSCTNNQIYYYLLFIFLTHYYLRET